MVVSHAKITKESKPKRRLQCILYFNCVRRFLLLESKMRCHFVLDDESVIARYHLILLIRLTKSALKFTSKKNYNMYCTLIRKVRRLGFLKIWRYLPSSSTNISTWKYAI